MSRTQDRLRIEVAHYLRLARGNYFTVWGLYVVSVGASIVATVLAASGVLKEQGHLLALVTAIPGVVILVNNTFKFNARSQWHYDKKRQLDSLLRLAEAGATTDPEVAAKWNLIDEEMDRTWPGWGELPKSPR